MKQWIVLFVLFCATGVSAQILEPVKWATQAKHLSGDEYELIIHATIDDNWAIYSQFLEGDDGPVPTYIEFDKADHFSLSGKAVESGGKKEAYDPVFQMNLIKFFHDAIFTQKVTVTDPSKPITGYLEFMTCDDSRCLPPTEVDLNFNLAGLKKEAAPGSTGEVAPKSTDKKTEPKVATADEEAEEAPLVADQQPETPGTNLFDPVHWSYGFNKIDDTTFDLIVSAKIDEGWAVYSQFLESDDGPIATYFDFEEGDHYSLIGKAEESGGIKKSFDPVFEMELVKFFHDAVFTQRVKVTDPTKPVTGYFEFMTCDDTRCLPPKEVEFSFDLTGEPGMVITTETAEAASSGVLQKTTYQTAGTPVDYDFDYEYANTDCGDTVEEEKQTGLWLIFLLGFGGGLVALLTPCVFPMIPLTVSFFTKSSSNKAEGIRNAAIYGLSIITIYVALGLMITSIFGADALNLLSTNAWFNIFFAVLFIVFAISFFGYFEITLPSSWANKTDAAADRGGLLGIFFMAFTLSLVSFSCTGPIIGTLLVETADGTGAALFGRIALGPLIGMLGFSTALALPFTLFAAFPGWLNSLPKSGGWMNSVKVTLGFIELALALKFLSVADLTMGWKILPYELFLAFWVLCAIGLALYFAGILKFPHDSPVKKYSPGRIFMIATSLLALVYIGLGFRYDNQSETFKTPAALSGLAPPAGHSYIYPKDCPQNINCYKDFYEGLASAKAQGKPLMIDFTGHGCVNCRKMEDQVWGKDGVYKMISEDYVLVSLYVDERKELDEPYISPKSNRERRTVGNRWADFQEIHLAANAQPQYVLVDPQTGKILNKPVGYTPDVKDYEAFLACGLQRFKADHK
ncbi:MAG: thioredoxin family protein [Saprospiraceae bacterium]|nr:thioredoxin family protein [Saprospiraceae bacterium]